MLKRLLSNKLALIGLLILVIGLPVVLWQVQRQQDNRQSAQLVATADFGLSPSSGTFQTNQPFNVDLIMNSGNYDVGYIEIVINYDPAKLNLTQKTANNPFQLFQETQLSNGSVKLTMLNSTTTPAAGDNRKIATLTFSGVTTGSTQVTINPDIKVTATGINGYLTILTNANMTGTYALVTGDPQLTNTPTPTTFPGTITPTNTPSPTLTPTPTVSPTPTSTIAPTQTLGNNETRLGMTIAMPGMGIGGSRNNNPVRSSRTATIALFNSSNQQVGEDKEGLMIYNTTTGKYEGTISLGENFTTGSYTVKTKFDNTLYKRIPGIVTITAGTDTNLASEALLVPGDINANNSLELTDYNILLACFRSQPACTPEIKTKADFNEDNLWDLFDENILGLGFSVREGD